MIDLKLVIPEIFLLSMICIVLLVDLFTTSKTKSLTHLLSQITLLITAGLCCVFPNVEETLGFFGHFAADPLAQLLKFFILVLMFVVLLYSRNYVKNQNMARGEYHLLVLFSTLGMMFLVSAQSLLLLYLGLELFSLPVYTLVALQRESVMPTEAAMKYFVTGALASGLLLFGMSFIYGLTQSLELSAIASHIVNAGIAENFILGFAVIFIVSGICFKFGAVPFHMWLPDVYQGAPTSITMLIGTAPKIAAFGMTYRLLGEALPELSAQWSQFMILFAILSLAVGNIVAIAQTNLKRMLGYSTIAHVGFILLAFVAGEQAGYEAALFYVLVYALTAACAFAMIVFLSHKGFEAENINDFKGLGQRNPWFAFLMLLTLFSFAGVPPTIGFYAKFMVLTGLVHAGYTWLAGVAVFFTIIGAFYYLRVIKVMYFDTVEVPQPVQGSFDMRVILSVNGLAVLALGILPASLYALCQQVLN